MVSANLSVAVPLQYINTGFVTRLSTAQCPTPLPGRCAAIVDTISLRIHPRSLV